MLQVLSIIGELMDIRCIQILILNITHTFKLHSIYHEITQCSLHIQVEEKNTKGPMHIYSRVLLNPHALHWKDQTEAFE